MSAERKLMGTTDATGGSANYIEDVFSTYMYTGNGSTQTINNGIDLAGKGGLVWLKARTNTGTESGLYRDNLFYDTERGANHILVTSGSYATSAELVGSGTNNLYAFNSNGFTLGTTQYFYQNATGENYASWTFRKAEKFFDVVTYTGNGANRTVAHNLGSVPGMIIVKRTDAAADWQVYHRSLANTEYMVLNTTAAKATGTTRWNSTTPTASVFSLGTDATVNASGGTYVAYLFAHDAGGFGASGTDNVISCGSFTPDATLGRATVNLGWEPQYVLAKVSGVAGYAWVVIDNMRGFTYSGVYLQPNSSAAEASWTGATLTPTGFSVDGGFGGGTTVVYIAIRRGPMRTPTSGTSVFSPITVNAAAGTKSTTGFPVDMQIMGIRAGTGNKGLTSDRLRGVSTTSTDGGTQLITSSNLAETTANAATLFWDNTGFQMPINYSSSSDIFWNFGRAPGFFDVVCYTGTGGSSTKPHNLIVAPELLIVKVRNANGSWFVYSSFTGSQYLILNSTNAATGSGTWTTPTPSVFTAFPGINATNETYIAYLFASCPGVSKVGSYTGNGTSQTIDCGFTAGARFVLIKRTDSAGDWYTWDSARGIIAGNDPHLSLNTTAAEVTTNDSIDPDSTGFIVNQVAATNINVSSASYIFLAIA